MKKAALIVALLITISISAQTDTVTASGTTLTGTASKNYTDRILFKDNTGTEYLIMKERITHLSTRAESQYGMLRINDVSQLNFPGLPEYKDQEFYLKTAGANGIAASVLIVGGGVLAGVGQALISQRYNAQDMVTVGSTLSTIGFCTLVPTFVFVLKAGKVKNYRTL